MDKYSIGMRFCYIPPGSFVMGSQAGEWEERPAHKVTVSHGFYMSQTPVTNRQYEQFDPEHRALRGKDGFSLGDNEAVVHVNHRQASAFCRWLSKKESVSARLPTEAEWEYACKAGREQAPAPNKEFDESMDLLPASLAVGRTPPNPWGLQDMADLVEEWCADRYGAYPNEEQRNPSGADEGELFVTRGGGVFSPAHWSRATSRLAQYPDEANCITGFRVVIGEQPARPAASPQPTRRWQKKVSREVAKWERMEGPVFGEPISFVIPPQESVGWYYPHNHVPSLCWCANGDLLAVWFSTKRECGREMVILASRYRQSSRGWDTADLFCSVPGRNMSCSSLLQDNGGKLYHFSGVGLGGTEERLRLYCRTSVDYGKSWGEFFPITEGYTSHKPIGKTVIDDGGCIWMPCDCYDKANREMGSVLYRSEDGVHFRETTTFGRNREGYLQTGQSAGWIAGVHGAVLPLRDGRLLALGRSTCLYGTQTVEGKMPMSISADSGATWTYSASPFPPIGSMQRHCLLRLAEGPAVLFSFTDPSRSTPKGMDLTDAHGNVMHGYGLFAAITYDEGETWSVQRLITPGGAPREMEQGASCPPFTMDDTHAQPLGYLQAVQTPDGIIHLISSRLHYRFNLHWLQAPHSIQHGEAVE